MKKRFLALALGTLAFGVTLGGVKMGLGHQDAMMVKAAGENQVAYKTLTFPDENKASNGLTQNQYASTWTAKCDSVEYTIKNFNNNNWQKSWTYIKCGSKNAASVASVTTASPFEKAITKVAIDLTITKTEYVNSIKLLTSDNAQFSNSAEYTLKITSGEQVVAVTNPTVNMYYQFVFDCKQGGGKKGTNGFIQVSTVTFFTNAAEIAPIDSITLEKTGAFNPTQFKGDKFVTDGLSVNALHTDSEISDVDLKDVQWFVKGSAPESTEVALLDENGLIANSLAAGSYTLVAKYNELASKENIALTIKDKVLATAVEIDVESPSIEVGETTVAIAVLSPNDATLQDVTWHAEDETIVSIDAEGNVKGLKAGTTKIYAVTKDGSSIESNRVEITVKGHEGKTYQQITADQADYSGTYLLGYKASATKLYTWNGVDKAGNYNEVELNGNVATGTAVADKNYIELSRINSKDSLKPRYSVKVVGGANDGKFVSYSKSTNGCDFADKEFGFDVSYDVKNGVVIKNSGNWALRFNDASNDQRFRFYSANKQQPVQLYRLDYTADVAVNAKAFADKFLAAPICGTDDNTPAIATEFNKFVDEYSTKLSRDVRAYLANGDGKGDASFDAFYAKYNAIMEKRASNTEFYDFLAGKYRPAKTQGAFGINQNVTDSTTWTLVGIGAVTIAASASLLFFRRKKSN